MKRTIAIAALVLAAANIYAQDTSKVSVKPYGFVRNYLNFDSRQMVTVCGGEYLMIPSDEDWNLSEAEAESLGAERHRFDRNAVAQTHLLALSTRFGVALTGPMVLGAKASGRVEGDFAGFGSNNTVLRLRLAYVNLDWRRHSLLVGQDWHPLSGSVMPDVLGMAAGAPFRPHSRTPQVRYSFATPSGFGFTAVALWQYQFTSPGPDGESAKYANQTLFPEFFAGIGYRSARFYGQLGVDYTCLTVNREIPVTAYLGSTPLYTTLLTNTCQALSPTLYMQYTGSRLSVKMRTTLASNLAHLNMLSGYAYATTDGSDLLLRPVHASVSYLNLAWTVAGTADKGVVANLFLGYQKNLGLGAGYAVAGSFADNLYMKKGIKNVNSLYRVAPSVCYNTRHFNLGLEYEWTAVTYGDIKNDASVDPKRQVSGHRLCMLVKYNF